MLRRMESHPNLRGSVDALPLDPLREALGEAEAWVVGGVVRDLLRGDTAPPDIDIAIDADLEPIFARLNSAAPIEIEANHVRFGTATLRSNGLTVDLARTRAETYPHPGALPEVEPAGIDADLERRDFTVNAMALPLAGGELLDPYGGAADLEKGTLRVLHDGSFIDDPTRAIRAARYAARLNLLPDPHTLALLRATNLSSVSEDRRRGELTRLATEATAPKGFRLLVAWEILELTDDAVTLIAAINVLAAQPPWSADASLRTPAIILAADGGKRLEAALTLSRAEPERPSEAVRLAVGHAPEELLLAAAAGGAWPADYVGRWRGTRLEIDGNDLISAGIPSGPAVGAGLQGALERKLDGGLSGGREAELELALELARRAI